jgi:TRAP-type C4-dicarboxylate transport system permease small subunit
LPRPLPPLVGRAIRAADGLAAGLAYLSGATLLLLAAFMTFDVLGRRFGGPYSRATDEISGYAMVLITSWALGYALSGGRHIRIDVMLHWFPKSLRRVLDYAGLALFALFAGILAWNSWSLAAESWAMDARSMTLQARSAYPQAVMAAGFSFLCLQCLVMLLAAPFRDLEELHQQSRDAGPEIYEI